jgi:hypothetical protein
MTEEGEQKPPSGQVNFREAIMKTFRREELDRVVWQPRIRYWYNGNQVDKPPGEIRQEDIPYPEVPARYRGKTPLEVYDMLRASPRYPGEILGIGVFRTSIDPAADIEHKVVDKDGMRITTTVTPRGEMRTIHKGGYPAEFPVKTPADCRVAEYVVENTRFEFDREEYERADRVFGHRGVIQSFYHRSPFQSIIVSYMGARNAFIQLHRNREAIEAFMEAIDRWHDHVYDVLVKSPLPILNFGENIDANLASPLYFKRYLVPFYQKRIDQLHRAGKFCHIHIDGAIKPLLPFLDLVDFDGIEAATPKPQGDVELDELKEGLGEKILLDGIPAVMFIPVYTRKQLGDFTRKVLETFSPNLILGVSDELPPTADITMMELVSEIVESYKP